MIFNTKLKNPPEIYTVFDIPGFPLEIIHDKKPYGVKFSFGYRFREPPLTPHTKATISSHNREPKDQKYKIFTIGDLNSSYPVIWDEAQMKKIPFLTFPEGTAQSRYMTTKLKDLSAYVDSVVSLNTVASTKKNIIDQLKRGEFHIIHLASNLFYLDMNPLKSYFLTPDGETLSIAELIDTLDYAHAHKTLQKLDYIRPLIIFDGRILNHNSIPINRAFIPYSNIMKLISTKDIVGVLAKITNYFDENIHDFLGTMLEQLLLSQSIGSSLLLGNRKLYLLGKKMQKTGSNLKLASILQEPHYIFYGEPSITLD